MTEVGAQHMNSSSGMDHALLARLTGELGSRKSIEKVAADLGQLYAAFLPDVFHAETGLTLEVAYAGHETGMMSELIIGLGDDYVVADAALRNWAPHFALACGNAFVITLMEHMLGALPETIDAPIERPLSLIELDLAVMVFDKIAKVLRSGVNPVGGFEPVVEPPVNHEDLGKLAPDLSHSFGAAIRMRLTLGPVKSEFVLIVPQKALLKTTVELPRAKAQPGKGGEAWAEQINEQVRRSPVTLEARIRLQSLTLGTIARLAAGDVIPFMDRSDVSVDVSANGKDLYVCEFGRAGANYTVRVKDNVSSDDEILQHLIG